MEIRLSFHFLSNQKKYELLINLQFVYFFILKYKLDLKLTHKFPTWQVMLQSRKSRELTVNR